MDSPPPASELNARRKLLLGEFITVAVIHGTLTPFIAVSMQFPPQVLLHYLAVTSGILYPLLLISARAWIIPWECRPIDALSGLLAQRREPPDAVIREARVRVLNLPSLHGAVFFVRYEAAMLLSGLALHFAAGLPAGDAVSLVIHATVGMAFFPVLSFLLSERLLSSVREGIAAGTRSVPLDGMRVLRIGLRTRLVVILLTTVSAPLIALGVLMYRRIGIELSHTLFEFSPDNPVMSHLFALIFSVTGAAVLLTSAIGVLLAMSIAAPLGHIVGVIGQVEKGNLGSRSNLLANDETGILSQSFDRMAAEIETSRAALENLNRELELRIAGKTEDLTRALDQLTASHRDMAVANQKLKELDRLKSDFVSVVSHEMRTPLTSIKAFAELMLMKPDMAPDQRHRFLSIINSESDRLTRLIGDILDLAKIEAGKVSWHMAEFALPDLIRASAAATQSLADRKKLAVRIELPDILPPVTGDRDRLLQVVTNILSNAIKFTPDGGGIIIAAGRDPEQHRQIVVRVTDSGIGVPPAHLESIFEKFRRTGDALTSDTEGTGLGLAIARQIVEHHGGRIWAESAPGGGSTFSFTLPLDRSRSDAGRGV